MFYLLKTIKIFCGDILNIAILISVEDVINKSLAIELVVLMNFSITQSFESSSFPPFLHLEDQIYYNHIFHS